MALRDKAPCLRAGLRTVKSYDQPCTRSLKLHNLFHGRIVASTRPQLLTKSFEDPTGAIDKNAFRHAEEESAHLTSSRSVPMASHIDPCG
jgi:hypothetical protein